MIASTLWAGCALDESRDQLEADRASGECLEPSLAQAENAGRWWREFSTTDNLDSVTIELENGTQYAMGYQWGKWTHGESADTPAGTRMRLVVSGPDGSGQTEWFSYLQQSPSAAACADCFQPRFEYANSSEWWREFTTDQGMQSVRMEIQGGDTHYLHYQWSKWTLGDVRTPSGTTMRLVATGPEGEGATRWFRYLEEDPSAASCGGGGGGDGGGGGGGEPPPSSDTMRVEGRHLYSAAGERVVLRGINVLSVWSSDVRGEWTMGEIAKTGANATRIVWNNSGNPSDFAAAVRSSIDNEMIAYVECHDATGDIYKVSQCVDMWTQPAMVSAIQDNKRWTLLNIANEAGANVSNEEYVSVYKEAITRIRNTGIRVPLVIDAAIWGQNYDQVFQVWRELRDHDPEQNLLFSTHSYWNDSWEVKKDRYDEIAQRVVAENVPLHLGEGPTPIDWQCNPSPYEYGMQVLDQADIGWLAWSWGGVNNLDCGPDSKFDMTTDAVYGNWQNWEGENIAVAHQYSIKNTAERPASIR